MASGEKRLAETGPSRAGPSEPSGARHHAAKPCVAASGSAPRSDRVFQTALYLGEVLPTGRTLRLVLSRRAIKAKGHPLEQRFIRKTFGKILNRQVIHGTNLFFSTHWIEF